MVAVVIMAATVSGAVAGAPAGSVTSGGVVHHDVSPGPMTAPTGATLHREPSIIGDDNRTRVTDTSAFPYSAIARVEAIDDAGQLAEVCSGALVGPDAVLTAGHCLWNPESGAWAKHIRVVPGKDGTSEPFGAAFATDWWVPDGFIATGGNADFDWGLIRLPDDRLGRAARWFAMSVLDDDALAAGGFAPAIAGYPADEPEGTMWVAATSGFASIEPFTLWYDIDTEAGESGAAIWSSNPAAPSFGRVVGIHTRGATGSPALNSGSRVDQQLVDDLLAACGELRCTVDVAAAPSGPARPAGGHPYGAVGPAIARD